MLLLMLLLHVMLYGACHVTCQRAEVLMLIFLRDADAADVFAVALLLTPYFSRAPLLLFFFFSPYAMHFRCAAAFLSPVDADSDVTTPRAADTRRYMFTPTSRLRHIKHCTSYSSFCYPTRPTLRCHIIFAIVTATDADRESTKKMLY